MYILIYIYNLQSGSIRVTKSKYVSVDDSKFNNSFSENNGGVFFIYNVDNFISNNIGIYNTTAIRNVYKIKYILK